MSSIERAALAFDELNEKRKALRVKPIDFEAWMQERDKDIASIRDSGDYREEVENYFGLGGTQQGLTMPWEKTHGIIRFRPAEVTCWHGYNGSGKSQVIGQVVMNLAMQGQKCCIASMEMHPYKTLARMARQIIGNSNPSPEYLAKFFDWASGKISFYDQQGTIHADRIIAVITYVCETMGVKQFVVDSLMKCGLTKETSHATYAAQAQIVDKLCAIAKDTGCHIHLVAHDKKPDDETARPNKYQISGSSDISNQVDNVIGVWRNKAKEQSEAPSVADEDVLLICDKQRNGEWEGDIKLWYHQESYRYLGYATEKVWSQL
jgi:twinkle protein